MGTITNDITYFPQGEDAIFGENSTSTNTNGV